MSGTLRHLCVEETGKCKFGTSKITTGLEGLGTHRFPDLWVRYLHLEFTLE
jgi:hypothetical protein